MTFERPSPTDTKLKDLLEKKVDAGIADHKAKTEQMDEAMDAKIQARNTHIHWELVKDYGLSATAEVRTDAGRASGREHIEINKITITEKGVTTIFKLSEERVDRRTIEQHDLSDQAGTTAQIQAMHQNHIDAVCSYFGVSEVIE